MESTAAESCIKSFIKVTIELWYSKQKTNPWVGWL